MSRGFVASILFFSVVGCADDVDAVYADDGADDQVGAEARVNNDAFYTFAYDMRKCMWPYCGGMHVSRVNTDTVCLDGTVGDSCYVVDVDFSQLGVEVGREDELAGAMYSGDLLARGKFKREHIQGIGNFAKFVVTEAWIGASNASPGATGPFVRVTPTEIACFAAPCENLLEEPLNTAKFNYISDLDFTPSGATEDEIAKAYDYMWNSPNHLIVAGDSYVVDVDGRQADGRTVTQFFLYYASAY
jgi:hypothetical protein